MKNKNKNKLNNPYIVEISNLTEDKLYKVKVFNHEHEKQDKIKYSCPVLDVSYNDLIRFIDSQHKPEIKIKEMTMISYCDYGKYLIRQFSPPLAVSEGQPDGSMLTKYKYFIIDPYQTQVDRITMDNVDFGFWYQMQIILPYLMPETKVTLYFYPERKDDEEKEKS